ncbi:hypothetical protein CAPTEDRAFT_186764 [Capitella teleta]|uniref:Uncharacterized protein n=1 Tax=Capitella teleta TaxID=283909 RepID=R7TGG8_CAPTE|nr:hypothetical protein CAPTEDRAFT_186764 [Capitella teleta]|eukprot:ELT90210.1 hypothetical protein CAPTEDRAFT_186764 [Capitella teleta]
MYQIHMYITLILNDDFQCSSFSSGVNLIGFLERSGVGILDVVVAWPDKDDEYYLCSCAGLHEYFQAYIRCQVAMAEKRFAPEDFWQPEMKRPRVFESAAAEMRHHLDVAYRKIEAHGPRCEARRMLLNLRTAALLRDRLVAELSGNRLAYFQDGSWQKYFSEQTDRPLSSLISLQEPGENGGTFEFVLNHAFQDDLDHVRDPPPGNGSFPAISRATLMRYMRIVIP